MSGCAAQYVLVAEVSHYSFKNENTWINCVVKGTKFTFALNVNSKCQYRLDINPKEIFQGSQS
jgi:hypothetical protein